MEDNYKPIIAIMGIISIIGIVYTFIAGLWGFNPTNIDWFNTKLGVTFLLLFSIVTLILDE